MSAKTLQNCACVDCSTGTAFEKQKYEAIEHHATVGLS
jgi:hypothetical protein